MLKFLFIRNKLLYLFLYKYKTTMKNLIILSLFLNSFVGFSQNLFTKDELILATDGGYRWYKDISIFLCGKYSKQDSLDVVETVNKFKGLIKPINISLVSSKDQANVFIYFNTDTEFISSFTWAKGQVESNIGSTFLVPVKYNINKVYIHIDILENAEFKSFSNTIRHEMFHMLGFSHYDNEKNSILDHDHYLTDKDIEMIRYLYSDKFKV